MYPPGLEPGLDGVGGRNVIQLHYEYIYRCLLFAHEGDNVLNYVNLILASPCRGSTRVAGDRVLEPLSHLR